MRSRKYRRYIGNGAYVGNGNASYNIHVIFHTFITESSEKQGMGNPYTASLKRFAKVRDEKCKTQTDMAKMLHITQGQYSDIESGKARLSRECLTILYSEGWDIDYIFIEQDKIQDRSTERAALRKQLPGYPNHMERFVLYYVWWILSCALEGDLHAASLVEELTLMRMLIDRQDRETVLYIARKMIKKSQIEMADQIGVCIKTYRQFEKEYMYPDAELLLNISRLTKCRVSLFMGLKKEEWNIAEYVWNHLDPEKQESTLEMINYNLSFINR